MPAEDLPRITLHFTRIGKPPRVFQDGLLEDNGVRLKTFSPLPPEVSQALSTSFQEEKLLKSGQWITGVAKFIFFKEYFSIMQFLDHAGQVLGVYTDIATPLQRTPDGYHLTDLCLDLWLTPEGRVSILDEEEFEQACRDGLIAPRLARTARLTLERLLGEIDAGIFPGNYTR
jgi:predicted RNA-binding protein associated with RNAse of E/G family